MASRILEIDQVGGRDQRLLVDADPPTFQNVWELAAMVELYQRCRPAKVLEVGSFHGGTLQRWLAADWRPTVVSIDLPVIAQPLARWQGWAEASGATLHTLAGSSHAPEAIALARELGPYDWVFIDADHTYAAVKADWDAYRPMVADGGVVLLHDINPRPDYGVATLWREIQAAGYLTQEINAGLPGLCGIGVVYL